ncbi:MAG: hypothetical protein ACRDXX_03900 [Stackebrandtia sp.]
MTMLFPHSVTAYPAVARRDADGNRVRSPSGQGVPHLAAYVQQRGATGDDASTAGAPSQRGRIDAVIYLTQDAPDLAADSEIDHDGDRYVLDDGAVDFRGLDGQVRFWRLEVRRIGGERRGEGQDPQAA